MRRISCALNWSQESNTGVGEIGASIEYHTELVRLADGNYNKSLALSRLGSAFQRRFELLGTLGDLESALEFATQAFQLGPQNPAYLNNLGNAWFYRFNRLGILADIDSAIECQSQAVRLAQIIDPYLPYYYHNLGASFHSRYERQGGLTDPEAAIRCGLQTLESIAENDPARAKSLSNLGNSWLSRFERAGLRYDLEAAIYCHQKAVELITENHHDMPCILNNLATSRVSRFKVFGNMVDLDSGIAYHNRVLQLSPDNHPDKAQYLTNLSAAWCLRYEQTGHLLDIDNAVMYALQGVQSTSDEHPLKYARLNNLGGCWMSRFERYAQLEDIDSAIKCQLQAAGLIPDDHPAKRICLSGLAVAWAGRYQHLNILEDLNKAVDCQEKVILLTPHNHPGRGIDLINLGALMRGRYERLNDPIDIDQAVKYHADAVQVVPDDHQHKAICLHHLGSSYAHRFCHTGNPLDIDSAIKLHSEAIRLTIDPHQNKHGFWSDLARSHYHRFQKLGIRKDIDDAIECLNEALQITPNGHSQRPAYLNNIGEAYFARFSVLNEFSDAHHAYIAFKEGATLPVTNAETQFNCARQWAKLCAILDMCPSLAFHTAFALIPRLVWLGKAIRDRYEGWPDISDLTATAAAWAFSVQSYDLALEWLEQGRSVVWGQMLQLRSPLDELELVDPALANKLRYLACQIDTASSQGILVTFTGVRVKDIDTEVQDLHNLVAQWEQVLEQVRQIPGFLNFMLPQSSRELKNVAVDGPIIVINAHSSRCDALIVQPHPADLVHVPLPDLSVEILIDITTKTASLLGHRGGDTSSRGFTRESSQNAIQPLALAWTHLVRPILEAVSFKVAQDSGDLPRVTWCSTGALSFLPLHAAGLYDGITPNTFDLVVSSYTPTLKAYLTHTHSEAQKPSGLLAVGLTSSTGLPPLPYAADELCIIKKRASLLEFHQLVDASATVEATIKGMEKHSWVHFACHALQDRNKPRNSAFYLRDGVLTVEDIARRKFKNKGLAYLSACQTATGDEVMPDEALHLAASMLMSGYLSVIATMWSIMDVDAPVVTDAVYAELLKDGKMDHRNSAVALHKAVGKLRKKIGVQEVARWAPFIHMGE